MSYSVIQKCDGCTKQMQCSDGEIIRGAVQGIIHQMGQTKGHLGWGRVDHICSGFEDKNAANAPQGAS